MTFGDKKLAVSFNLDKEHDLYEFAAELTKKKQFSAIMKQYLQLELQRRDARQRNISRGPLPAGESSITVRLEE